MFKADANHTRRHTRPLRMLTAAVGLLMLTSGTAFAQGWSSGNDRHGGDGSHTPPPAPTPDRGHDDGGPLRAYRCDSSLDVQPGMADHELRLSTSGVVECNDVTGASCTGYLSREPICLDVRRPLTLDIEVTHADVDTVLALTGNGLVRTDDDGGYGTNSRITQYLTPGQYRLYTGTYTRRSEGSLSVAFRDASPAPPAPPRRGGDEHGHGHGHGHDGSVVYGPAAACPAGSQVVSLSRWQSSQWVSTQAFGDVDSSDRMGQFEPGWFPSTAQICLVVDEPGNYSIEVTSSDADTVLGVVPAGGSGPRYFDDDGGSGWLSRVSGRLDGGAYLVYVGTFGRGTRSSAQLVLTRN